MAIYKAFPIILALVGGGVFFGGAWDSNLLDMALGTVTMFVAHALAEQENEN